jgi:hypothetical protein
MELIKVSQDGCKRYKFEGIEFFTNSAGAILWAEDWSVTDLLEKAGLVERNFYRHLYGHVEHIVK